MLHMISVGLGWEKWMIYGGLVFCIMGSTTNSALIAYASNSVSDDEQVLVLLVGFVSFIISVFNLAAFCYGWMYTTVFSRV